MIMLTALADYLMHHLIHHLHQHLGDLLMHPVVRATVPSWKSLSAPPPTSPSAPPAG